VSIDWKEAEALFHTVAVHTRSEWRLFESESNAAFFDVTRRATHDSEPVGGINRARWRSEAARHEVRLAGGL
jgi:hypothetical protein